MEIITKIKHFIRMDDGTEYPIIHPYMSDYEEKGRKITFDVKIINQDGQKIYLAEYLCPECKAPNEDGLCGHVVKCEYCGVYSYRGERMSFKRCLNCQTPNNLKTNYCKKCGIGAGWKYE